MFGFTTPVNNGLSNTCKSFLIPSNPNLGPSNFFKKFSGNATSISLIELMFGAKNAPSPAAAVIKLGIFAPKFIIGWAIFILALYMELAVSRKFINGWEFL